MKKINKIFAVLLLITAVISMSACASYEETPEIDLGEPAILISSDIPALYQETVNDYISINAEVTVPESIDFGYFTASKKDFSDIDAIQELFITGEFDLKTSIDEEYGSAIYNYTADNGDTLLISSQKGSMDYLYFLAGNSFCTRNFETTQSWNLYSTFTDGMFLKYDRNLDEIYTGTEIDGLDRSEAVAIAEEKLNELNIEYIAEPKVYVIDRSGIEKFISYKGNDPSMKESADKFTEEDEAYFIIFNHSYQGMPISYERFDTLTANYEPDKTYAVVTRSGIAEMKVSAGYAVTKDKTQTLPIYNADVLGKALKKYIGSIEMENSVEFVSMKLEYMAENDSYSMSEGLEFVPFWECAYVMDIDGTSEYSNQVFINASTGELLGTYGASALI